MHFNTIVMWYIFFAIGFTLKLIDINANLDLESLGLNSNRILHAKKSKFVLKKKYFH